MSKIDVCFRVLDDDIIALFPDEAWDNRGCITSYMHVGQHGGASPDLIALPVATQEEYADLERELTDVIGYELNILTA